MTLIGMPYSDIVLHASAQLERRFGMRVSLHPFGWNTPEQQIEFRMFLNFLDEKLPFSRRSGLADPETALRIFCFTLEQFRDADDQWSNSKEASDNLEAGWKEYWKKNYGLAAQLGASSKNTYKEKLRRDKQERLEDGRKFIRSVHLEGNARYAENDFRAAMTAYQEIETAFNEAETKNLLGNAKSELGIRVEGQESQSLLGEAVAAFREALKVRTRERFPQQWAATQNNLGNTLTSQGGRAEGAG
jgi:tetratricopeptide (TPR) repeat protein